MYEHDTYTKWKHACNDHRITETCYHLWSCRPHIEHGVSSEAQASTQRHELHYITTYSRGFWNTFYTLRRLYLCCESKESDIVLRAYCDASFGPTSKTYTNHGAQITVALYFLMCVEHKWWQSRKQLPKPSICTHFSKIFEMIKTLPQLFTLTLEVHMTAFFF